ncbi:MAG TPA: sigma-70 family RNA polymerase sigma factor [Alloacidobacterium sp.]|nr:sigma-70 family RNA polymerase sigma factor [Alloacidobacterium sp.]
MSATEDQADVERVLSGDVASFEGIVRRWQGPLVNMAYRFCNDRGRAEEMAQEAFLRVYRSLASWRRDAAFSTWLFAVAANLYRSELKRIPAGNVALDDVAELMDKRSHSLDFEEHQRDRMIRRAVMALPAKYRDAMILYYFHEMDVPAASKSLGVPEGTVKARLFRGREILRSKLPQLLEVSRLKEA